MARRETAGQLIRFAGIGAASTAAYVVLYAGLRTWSNAAAANAVALLLTTVANTAANRRFTFGVHGAAGRARDHLAGLLAFSMALAVGNGSLAALHAVAPHATRGAELVALVAGNALATVLRFVLLRTVVAGIRPPALAMARQPTDRSAAAR